jgi:hypothetical protein
MNEYEPLKGFEKLYVINREGSIWSYYSKNGRLMNTLQHEMNHCLSKGYKVVNLRKNGIKKHRCLHRLLALQFIPNPNNLPDIDHINRNKLDNSLENLRWVTSKQNNNNRTNKSIHPFIRLTPFGKYCIRFKINGVMTHIGCYKTLEEALSERDCHLDLHGIPNYCWD